MAAQQPTLKAMTTASWRSGRALATAVATQQAVVISSMEYRQEQQQAVGAGNRIEYVCAIGICRTKKRQRHLHHQLVMLMT